MKNKVLGEFVNISLPIDYCQCDKCLLNSTIQVLKCGHDLSVLSKKINRSRMSVKKRIKTIAKKWNIANGKIEIETLLEKIKNEVKTMPCVYGATVKRYGFYMAGTMNVYPPITEQ